MESEDSMRLTKQHFVKKKRKDVQTRNKLKTRGKQVIGVISNQDRTSMTSFRQRLGDHGSYHVNEFRHVFQFHAIGDIESHSHSVW